MAPYNILFLCTGNSARSVIGEALANAHGRGLLRGFSAGSQPKGAVNPYTIRVLQEIGLPVEGLASKSWEDFAGPGAPQMDFIVTVCDSAASEACPIWPGKPTTAHWGLPDPAAVTGDDAHVMNAFRRTVAQMRHRLDLLMSLPLAELESQALAARMRTIGQAAERP